MAERAMPDKSRPEIGIHARPVPAQGLAGDTTDVPPLLQRIYASRGVRHTNDLRLTLDALATPATLPDCSNAAHRLADAVMAGERILIVGDFDADGATSVALAISVLRAFGTDNVSFLVPNRFEFGYGLSPEIVELALIQSPAVIVTVDNGVSSTAGVALANEHGVDVIITDHHLPADELPEALAIVNPNLAGSQFPSKAMAGVGVIYYVMSATRAELRQRGWFATRPSVNLADWLDLVALGTVADVVALDHNNRILVYQGLRRIRAGRCRPGFKALCAIAGRSLQRIDAQDLGFAVGPRLNAAGRLDDMAIGIRCLLAADAATATEIATALDELNQMRRVLEQEMVSDAELIVAGRDEADHDQFGVCVYDPSWHQGIVGIVAGRLREKLHRPVIAFADAGDAAPDELKGSARSVPQLHIRDVLDAIAARYPGMLVKFGGHAMAAGMSIKRVHFERFTRAFNTAVEQVLPVDALSPVLLTDGSLLAEERTLAVARRLAAAGPWGQQFPEPSFYDEFELVNQRVVGEQHLKLVLKKDDRLFDAIAFRQPSLGDIKRVAVVYKLQENDYRDAFTLQLMVEHLTALA